MMPFQNAGCRVRIGITGHRALPDAERIARRFRRFLENQIHELLGGGRPRPENVPVSFCAVTSLAEGADRILAREVLRQPGGSIEVVLPMAAQDYAADFNTPESRAEFSELCGAASSITVLNGHLADTEPNGPQAGGARPSAYEDAGRYIVDHCDLLAAVWDGGKSRGPGGTAEVVEYARECGRPLVVFPSLDPGAPKIEKGAGVGVRLEDLALLNRIAADEIQGNYLANVTRDLFEGAGAAPLSEAVRTPLREGLLPFYVAASLLAKKNQRRRNLAGLLVPILSLAAVAAVALGVLFRPISPLAFAVELFLLLTVLWVLAVSEMRRNQQRWLEFRVLAERLRCAVFLAVSDVEPEPRHSPSDWTAAAAHEIGERVRRRLSPAAGWPEARDFVLNRWVARQRDFHKSRAERMGRRGKRLRRLSKAMFLLAIAVSAAHVFVFDVLGHYAGREIAPESAWVALSFLAVVLPAAGAAVASIRSQREYERQAGQSREMERRLAELQRRLAAARSREELVPLVRQVCRLCIQDAQDWRGLMHSAVVEAV